MRSAAASARTRQLLADATVVGVLIGVVTWRLVVLFGRDEPVGVDVANWVRMFHGWFGQVDVADVVMPPLVPLLCGVLAELVGLRATSHLVMALGSVAPAVGVWVVCRRRCPEVVVVAAVGAVAMAGATAAATAWGGLPQLLGLGLLPVVVERCVALGRNPDARHGASCGRWLLVTALVSTLVFSIAAVMLVVALLLTGGAAFRTGAWLSRFLLFVAPVVPLYAVILVRISLPAERATAIGAQESVGNVLSPLPVVWVLVAATAVAGLVAATAVAGRVGVRSWSEGRQISVALLVGALLVPIAGDVRFAYAVPSAVAVAACVAAAEMPVAHRMVRSVVRGGVAVLFVVIAVAGVGEQVELVDTYAGLAPEGITDASEWLAANVPGGEAVLVAPVAGAPTGWIVEAHDVDALVASRPDWLFFPQERAEAEQAVDLLSGTGWPTDEDLARVSDAGVDWVLVPHAWGGADQSSLVQLLDECPDRVAVRTESYTVLAPSMECASGSPGAD